jgi:hypothetical protein
MELGQAAVAIYQARLNRTPRALAKATIAGVSGAAVTAVVVGDMLLTKGIVTAGTLFLSAALPWVLGGALIARGLYHLAMVSYHLERGKTALEPAKEKINRDIANEQLLRGIISILVGVAFMVLMATAVANPVALAVTGIIAATVSVNYAFYKLVVSTPKGYGLKDVRVEQEEDDDDEEAEVCRLSSPSLGNTAMVRERLGIDDVPAKASSVIGTHSSLTIGKVVEQQSPRAYHATTSGERNAPTGLSLAGGPRG